jgi:hypothetical protein
MGRMGLGQQIPVMVFNILWKLPNRTTISSKLSLHAPSFDVFLLLDPNLESRTYMKGRRALRDYIS